MSNEFEETYIGDGVYAHWDGFAVKLTTERDNGTHFIYLEPDHLQRLMRLVWADQDMLNLAEPRIARRRAGQG